MEKVLFKAQLVKYTAQAKAYVKAAVKKVSDLIEALKLENITDVEASAEEVNYLKGVTSGVQAQINAKAPLANPNFTGVPTAPTATSGDSSTQIATTEFVKGAVDGLKADLGSALTYKGSVADYDSLPKEGQEKGDTYNVVAAHGNTPAGTNYAWDGSKWDPLGGDIDLSNLAEKSTTLAGYGIQDAKIDDGTITLGSESITPLTEEDLEAISDTEIEEMWKDDESA